MRTAVFVGALALLWTAGCTQTVSFPGSPVVPGAEARAKITKDRNGNAEIDLRVKHLARPKSLFPPRAVYLVWAQSADGSVANLGRLVVDDELEGRFKAITPMRELRLLVTAEDDPLARLPSLQVVIATEVFRVR